MKGDTTDSELHEKLASWAGFHPIGSYTKSLDLCFNWLVPKLRRGMSIEFGQSPTCQSYEVFLVDDNGQIYGEADTASEALCRAIEAYIEGSNA